MRVRALDGGHIYGTEVNYHHPALERDVFCVNATRGLKHEKIKVCGLGPSIGDVQSAHDEFFITGRTARMVEPSQ